MRKLFILFVVYFEVFFSAQYGWSQQAGKSVSEKNIISPHQIESRFAEPDESNSTARPSQAMTTYIVTNTNDDAASGSLRWAITQANANPGQDLITFAIGNGPQTIAVKGNLPFITDPVIIDGTTQPGYSGKPIIVINGANSNDYGLRVTKGPSMVRGLVINGFPLGGISVGSAQFQRNDSITVEGCYIGTDISGTMAVPNGGGTNSSPNEGGITVFYSGNDQIGGTTIQTHNLISGNNGPGITLEGSAPLGSRIYGNWVGTNASGTEALPNQGPGILLVNTNHQTIGATANTDTTNVISGNRDDGIELRHKGVFTNRIRGNFIGTDFTGTLALPNQKAGIFINGSYDITIGGSSVGRGNVISSNQIGIRIDSGATANIIQRDLIGTDIFGEKNLGNKSEGILIKASGHTTIGGMTPILANRIAYNGVGIAISDSTGNSINGNSLSDNDSIGIRLTSGGNNLQKFPTLDSAVETGLNTIIYGRLVGKPNTAFTIELFTNEHCHHSGFGEGEYLLARTTATTNSQGKASFNVSVSGSKEDSSLTATATDPDGNTSQFSACLHCPEVRIAFTPDQQGFSFGNEKRNMWPASLTDAIDYTKPKYAGLQTIVQNLGGNIKNTDFPDWELFAEAFGDSAVYTATAPARIYKTHAVQIWMNHKDDWHGSCEGFSIASLLELADNTTFPISYLRDSVSPESRNIVNKYYMYQYSAQALPYFFNGYEHFNPADVVDSLRRSFMRAPSRYQPISIYRMSSDGVSAHSLVAYRIKCDTTSEGEVDSVFVYDSNHPNDSTRAIKVWREGSVGYWFYPNFGIGVNRGFAADFEISIFAKGNPVSLPKILPASGKNPIIASADKPASIYFGDNAFVSVKDNSGHEINTRDSLTGNLPNASYIIPRTGGVSRVEGFYFSAADPSGWTVNYSPQDPQRMNYLNSSNAQISLGAHFMQSQMNTAQHFTLDLSGEALSLKANAPGSNFGASMIWNSNGGENSLHVVNSSLAKNDSLRFQLETSTKNLIFTNAGTKKEYALSLRRATARGEMNKHFGPIDLGQSELHTLIVGNWDNLDTTTILIKVDRGMNGSTDSTIVLQSGAAIVREDLAAEFHFVVQLVAQGAKISYFLPKESAILLCVTDGLGRNVATLASERQSSGFHEITFDETKLVSGVYFFQLSTEGKTAVQKVVWVK